MTVRWVLRDTATNDEWTMPLNPDGMSPLPLVSRNFRHAYFRTVGYEGVRTFQVPAQAADMEWQGWIHTEAHYNALVEWAEKTVEVVVTDHLGRSFTIFIKAFEPQERRFSRRTPWRMRYRMSAVLLAVGESHAGTSIDASVARGLV